MFCFVSFLLRLLHNMLKTIQSDCIYIYYIVSTLTLGPPNPGSGTIILLGFFAGGEVGVPSTDDVELLWPKTSSSSSFLSTVYVFGSKKWFWFWKDFLILSKGIFSIAYSIKHKYCISNTMYFCWKYLNPIFNLCDQDQS